LTVVTAGYSGTPLPKKLGIKAGARVLLDGAPAGLAFEPLPDGVEIDDKSRGEPYDVVLLFTPESTRLHDRWAESVAHLETAGRLWICWPKKSSGVPTDLTENVIRDYGLEQGLVDVKVCAVDETWSGLAFVRRLRDR
jgi:hypothetical protein